MSNLWVWVKSLGFAVCGAIAFCGNSAIAQITPDGTLPANSQVRPDGNITNIEGGTRAGNNLFHSFEQFSVPTGITAYFQNPTDIQNIISRVTGKSISNIDGILKANGTANVFLINPNGIIFGANASLQIGGSFVASTASSLNFADGTKFSVTDPRTTPLLTVSVPIGLQFGANAAPIRNQSRYPNEAKPVGLQVQPHKTLALVGGNITFEGGTLTATSGRVELGSVAANSLVSLNSTVQGWVLGYEGVQNFQNIQLIPQTVNGSDITSRINTNNTDSSGGNIQVQGNTVELMGYLVGLTTQATGVADGPDLTINARKLIVRDGAVVSTTTISEGNGGKLTVNASDLVEVIGSSRIPNMDSIQPSELLSSTVGSGNAGDLTINTNILRIENGAKVSSETPGQGNGGKLNVNASDLVEVIGGSQLLSSTGGSGNAGDLTINTNILRIKNGGEVSSDTINEGNGGKLTVNASDLVEVIDSYPIPNSNFILPSELLSSTGGSGKAGDLTINTNILRIQNGGQVSTDSIGLLGENSQSIPGKGAGGDLTVNASESVELIGTSTSNLNVTSGLFALTNTSGDAGKVTINTGKLIIQDRAKLTVSSEKNSDYTYPDGYILGKAGDVDVFAGSILLDNQGKLTSNSESGKGGNIMLKVGELLLMRRNSEISTNAAAKGDGGQITINAPNGFVVATPFGNNDITANANFGSGGKITITAKNIFGFVPRTRTDLERLLNTKDPEQLKPSNLPTSDITAFSQQDPSLNGTVQINSPDADPSKGLVELPVNLVDASQQIAASCSSGGKIARNSFITTGRGGLVADPTEPLIADDAVLADWIALPPESQNRAGGIQKRAVARAQRNTEKKSQKINSVNELTQIVEAQGWIIDANGNVVLVAQVPTTTPHNSSLTNTSCAAH